jgi:hypothetical protein
VRRVLLFAILLAMFGLSTAFAASLSVQSEDIASFTTPVSVSVPAPPTSVIAFFLSGDDAILPGFMAPSPPPDNSVNSKSIKPSTGPVRLQTATDKYHSWQTDPAPAGGLVLSGPAVLRIFQNGSVGAATAALFECPTATTVTASCRQVAGDTSSAGTESAGTEVPISFGVLSDTIQAGSRLRVQIVNLGSHQWNLQWGYKSNRESRLDLSVATP